MRRVWLACLVVTLLGTIACAARQDERPLTSVPLFEDKDVQGRLFNEMDVDAEAHDHRRMHRHIVLRSGALDTRDTPDVHRRVASDWFPKRWWQNVRTWTRGARPVAAGGVRKTHLLHVQGPVKAAQRTRIEAALRVRLGPYVPHHSFLVHLTDAEAQAAADLPDVLWVGPFRAAYKVCPRLADWLDMPNEERRAPATGEVHTRSRHEHGTHLFVVLTPADHSRTLEDAQELAGRWQRMLLRGGHPVTVTALSADKLRVVCDAHVDRDLVDALAAQEDAHFVELAPHYKLANKFAQWITQSGSVDHRPVWDAGLTGAGQIVGCADSGLDYDNCLFDDAGRDPSTSHRKVVAYEVAPGNDDTDDVNGHGTHVVGSIVGNPAGSGASNADGWEGLAKDAKVYFTDIGETGGGLAVPGDLNTGLFPNPYDAGARIHSNSWGSASPDYTSTAAEVDRFMYNNDDFLVLVAAGNDGGSPEAITMTIGSPATSKNCLAVGASQTSNAGFVDSLNYYDWAEREQVAIEAGISDCCTANQAAMEYCCQSHIEDSYVQNRARWDMGNVAPFSSRGPTSDGRIKPELLAPGQMIVSAHSNGNGNNRYHCDAGEPNAGNDAAKLAMAGTSMATPVMAGLATLVREYYADGWYPTGSPSSADAMTPSGALIKATLIASAVALDGEIDLGNNGTWVQLGAVPSIWAGFGRVQLSNALKLGASSTRTLWIDDTSTIGTDETRNYCVSVNSGGSLRATLVWTDPPGTVSSAIALVNDLNLYMGRDDDVITGNWQTTRDVRNNVEQATVAASGGQETLKVQIKGWNVPQGPQKYALVLTGEFDAASVQVDGSCELVFEDNFEAQPDDVTFPLGAAVGIGAVGLVGGLMVLLSLIIFKDKNTLGRICAGLQQAGGGRQ